MEINNIQNQENRDEEVIESAKKHFDDTSSNYKLMKQYEEKFYEIFFKVKLAFIGFIGVLLTIIFNIIEKFTKGFVISLSTILVLIFILLIIEWWLKLRDLNNALAHSYRSNILAKIKHIAKIEEGRFSQYDNRSSQILIQRDDVWQAMENNEPISVIINEPKNRWQISFVIWSLLFLAVPVLLILEILKILK